MPLCYYLTPQATGLLLQLKERSTVVLGGDMLVTVGGWHHLALSVRCAPRRILTRGANLSGVGKRRVGGASVPSAFGLGRHIPDRSTYPRAVKSRHRSDSQPSVPIAPTPSLTVVGWDRTARRAYDKSGAQEQTPPWHLVRWPRPCSAVEGSDRPPALRPPADAAPLAEVLNRGREPRPPREALPSSRAYCQPQTPAARS